MKVTVPTSKNPKTDNKGGSTLYPPMHTINLLPKKDIPKGETSICWYQRGQSLGH